MWHEEYTGSLQNRRMIFPLGVYGTDGNTALNCSTTPFCAASGWGLVRVRGDAHMPVHVLGLVARCCRNKSRLRHVCVPEQCALAR